MAKSEAMAGRIARTSVFLLTVACLLVVGAAATRPAPAAAPAGPRIDSFSPRWGVSGTAVTITGVGLVNVTAVSFNGVQGSVDLGGGDDPTQATVVVPAGATTGPVSLMVDGQRIVSAKRFFVPAGITSVNPGTATTGSLVLFRGFGLSHTSDVVFGGASAEFVVVSSTKVVARVPAAAGEDNRWVHLVVDGYDVSLADPFFVIPTITSVSPMSGAVDDVVTITGSGFRAKGRVSFNGVAATHYESIEASSIVVHVPDGATTGPIQVTDEGGASAQSDPFSVLPPGP